MVWFYDENHRLASRINLTAFRHFGRIRTGLLYIEQTLQTFDSFDKAGVVKIVFNLLDTFASLPIILREGLEYQLKRPGFVAKGPKAEGARRPGEPMKNLIGT